MSIRYSLTKLGKYICRYLSRNMTRVLFFLLRKQLAKKSGDFTLFLTNLPYLVPILTTVFFCHLQSELYVGVLEAACVFAAIGVLALSTYLLLLA